MQPLTRGDTGPCGRIDLAHQIEQFLGFFL